MRHSIVGTQATNDEKRIFGIGGTEAWMGKEETRGNGFESKIESGPWIEIDKGSYFRVA